MKVRQHSARAYPGRTQDEIPWQVATNDDRHVGTFATEEEARAAALQAPQTPPFHEVTEREEAVLARLVATGKVGSREKNLDTKPREPRGAVAGFVYFILNERGHVKIGAAKNPLKRLRTFQTANDGNLELVGFIETDDMYRTERRIQKTYRHARVRGEWYKAADVVIP